MLRDAGQCAPYGPPRAEGSQRYRGPGGDAAGRQCLPACCRPACRHAVSLSAVRLPARQSVCLAARLFSTLFFSHFLPPHPSLSWIPLRLPPPIHFLPPPCFLAAAHCHYFSDRSQPLAVALSGRWGRTCKSPPPPPAPSPPLGASFLVRHRRASMVLAAFYGPGCRSGYDGDPGD